VSLEMCDDVLVKVDAARSKASADDFTKIHNRKRRKDLPLPLHGYSHVIKDMMDNKLVRGVLESIVKPTASLV